MGWEGHAAHPFPLTPGSIAYSLQFGLIDRMLKYVTSAPEADEWQAPLADRMRKSRLFEDHEIFASAPLIQFRHARSSRVSARLRPGCDRFRESPNRPQGSRDPAQGPHTGLSDGGLKL